MITDAIAVAQNDKTSGAVPRLRAGVQRLWTACLTWRSEVVAIATLNSMSDHELNDIGLPRSEIASAVKGGRHEAPGSPAPAE